MRTLAIGVLALASCAVYAQPYRGGLAPQPYGSVSGFGSVLFPGLGHAPLPNGTAGLYGGGGFMYPGGLYGGMRPVHPGNTVGNRRFDGGRGRGGNTMIVPYPVVTGGYYGYDPEAPPQQVAQQPQTVVLQQPAPAPAAPNITINQYFKSDGTPAPEPSSASGIETGHFAQPAAVVPRRTVDEERATIYLIAFKDQTIMPALGYWVEGDTLNYITKDGTHNTASMSLIDKKFSQQLNDERQVEFTLR